MKVIGLVGLAGSGKNTVGDYIGEKYGYSPISFADSLKDCVGSIFGWDRQLLEGTTPASRLWREQIDPWWADRLGIPNFSPRFAMTDFGSDIMRKYFNDNIWVINTERRIMQRNTDTIITDIRFPIEIALTRRLGGLVGRVQRGDDPSWVPIAKDALRGDLSARHDLDELGVHHSEWSLMLETPDWTIHNDGDLNYLYGQIDQFMNREHVRYTQN